MPIKILVTRPEPGLSKVLKKLKALDKEPIAGPMLQIKTLPPLAPISADTILVTSVHALPALNNQDRNCRILSVGKVTASAAKALGFRNVFSAEGNAQKLKELYQAMGCSAESSWLAAGSSNDGKLYGDFLVDSLGISRFKTYQVKWEESLSDNVRDFLKADGVKQILFYSSETVRSFFKLIETEAEKSNLQIDRKEIEILCFSSAIAETVKKDPLHLEWATIENNLDRAFS